MALEYNGKYLRVENLGGDKRNLVCVLRTYDDGTSTEVLAEEGHVFIPTAETRWDAQAYEHIKTLPKYDGNTTDI